MTNSPFLLTTSKNQWAVHWPTFKNIKDKLYNIILLDIIFGEIKCDQAGLSLLFDDDNSQVLWIDSIMWFQDNKKQYSEYLQDMYQIQGVVFRNKSEALQFQDILEKKYIWKVLKYG